MFPHKQWCADSETYLYFVLTPVSSARIATFERHLREEARKHGISPKVPLSQVHLSPDNVFTQRQLRDQLTEAMQRELASKGWGIDGTQTQLRCCILLSQFACLTAYRERLRQANLIERAHKLNIRTQDRTPSPFHLDLHKTLSSCPGEFVDVKKDVFNHYRSQLREYGASTRGNLGVLSARLLCIFIFAPFFPYSRCPKEATRIRSCRGMNSRR